MSIKKQLLYIAQPCKEITKHRSGSIFQESSGALQGPRYDIRGEIIRRSIVGSVEQFNREGKLQDESKDDSSSMHRSFVLTHLNRRNQNKKRREPAVLYSKISKEQIRLHIEQIRSNNSIKLQQIDKQQKVLESCEERREKWNQIEQKLASRCRRSTSDTLLSQSQGYRERKQLIDTLNIQQQEPKQKEWYDKLRIYDNQKTQQSIEIIKTRDKVKICSEKFKQLINKRLSQKYYDPDYVMINGQSKLTMESIHARDIIYVPTQIQEEDMIQLQQQK